MNCEYCNTGLEANAGSCHKCGAPCKKQGTVKRCACGLILDDKIAFYKIPELICHNCFNVFEGSFYGKYQSDKIYENGQITHLFTAEGLVCPYCGVIFSGHEYYHDTYTSEGKEALIEVAKNAHFIK